MTSIKVPAGKGTRVGGYYQTAEGPGGRVLAVDDAGVAVVELEPPVGVAEDGSIRFREPKAERDYSAMRLVDCEGDAEIAEWAKQRVWRVIADHPNEEDRATAFLALGILLGLRR